MQIDCASHGYPVQNNDLEPDLGATIENKSYLIIIEKNNTRKKQPKIKKTKAKEEASHCQLLITSENSKDTVMINEDKNLHCFLHDSN